MTSREFIALVRAGLDAAGHRDIAVSRSWIDEDTPGESILLHVPVGAELSVPLRPLTGFANAPASDVAEHIGHFVAALITLKRAERMLCKYAGDVRKTANAHLTLARARGLDVQLAHVGFKPTYAYHLSGNDWKDGAMHVLAAVTIRHLSFYLRPETSVCWIEEPEQVGRELNELLEKQLERQQRLAELEELGFDLEMDRITLDLLSAHDLDATETLRQVWKDQCVNLSVRHRDADATLSLISSDGRTTASLLIDDVIWNGEYLWFRDEACAIGNDDLVGKCLGDRVTHPAFKSRPVAKVERSHGGRGIDLIYFDMSDKLRFDADTGRMWPVDELKAA